MPINFSHFLTENARLFPDKTAVIFPSSCHRRDASCSTAITFHDLEVRINAFAHGLNRIGVQKGMRVAFLVKPGPDFLPLIFALLKIGAISVLIDPGMKLRFVLPCLQQVEPEVFIGVPLTHFIRRLFPRYLRSVHIKITTGRLAFGDTHRLDNLVQSGMGILPEILFSEDDHAAIVFTTGSTGPPKGVIYTQGMFISQLQLMRDKYDLSPEDIDMPGFAMFAVFSIAAGMTVVLPEMDPRKPAMVNPRKIAECINHYRVTFSFGSPALWKRIAPYCLEKHITFPSLKRILMAGAPIPWYLHEQYLRHILAPGAEIYTPYGATECLMTTSFQGTEVLASTMMLTRAGNGYCVGHPYPGITVKIIKISDQPLKDWKNVTILPVGKIGEVVVCGTTVSPAYYALPTHTEWHKIFEYDGEKMVRLWHRLGDIGYLDDHGRLWFCGRQSQRVETGSTTLYTVCCEAIFNEHPRVNRSALVGIGSNRYQQRPVMIIEPKPGDFPYRQRTRHQFIAELIELARQNPLTAKLTDFLFHRRFPVDIRHNAKIFREKLALWAQERVVIN